MTIQQCYEAIGSPYEEVFQRLRSEQLIGKFMVKFLDDPSFWSLLTAMESGDKKAAVLAAHTLKGVSQNLGFIDLYEASAKLTEALRKEEDAAKLLDAVKAAYEKTVSAISRYQKETAQKQDGTWTKREEERIWL